MKTSQDTVDRILTAAEDVVIEVGAGHLTLDAVSERAGVSKGGLLYHFPTKEALIRGMIERLLEWFEQTRAEEARKLPEGPGRELKAHILSMSRPDPHIQRISAALLAAAAFDPSLLEPVRESYRQVMARFSEGLDPQRAARLSLAMDGLWIMELLGLSPFEPRQREEFIQGLIEAAGA